MPPPPFGGIRTRNPSKRAAVDRRLRPRAATGTGLTVLLRKYEGRTESHEQQFFVK